MRGSAPVDLVIWGRTANGPAPGCVLVAYPSVFEVPDSEAMPHQVPGQIGGLVGTVSRPPEPAVDDHRPGAWAVGKAEHTVLARMGAVAH